MAAQRFLVIFSICLVLQAGESVSPNDVQDFKCARAVSEKFVYNAGRFFNYAANHVNKEFNVVKFAKEQGYVEAAFYNASMSRSEFDDVFRNVFRSFKFAAHVFERFHGVRSFIAKHAANHFRKASNAMDIFFKCSNRNAQ